MILIIIGLVIVGVMMWLLIAGVGKREKEWDEEEMRRWFEENSEGYDTLYEKIREEDVPEGFKDIFR